MQNKTLNEYLEQLKIYVQQSNYSDSIDLLKNAISQYPEENKLKLNLGNIYKYVKLDLAKIFTVKYKNKVRSLEPQKKKKKKKNCFQNQMTVEIKPDLEGYPDSKVSVKIFKNGSIQMSGIKSIEACNTVLNKLINARKP